MEGKDKLHRCYTNNRGQEFLNIKQATSNDAVRSALSHLNNDHPSRAATLDHSNCLRDAHRTCKESDDGSSKVMLERLCGKDRWILFP
jgi:hypothetical protein